MIIPASLLRRLGVEFQCLKSEDANRDTICATSLRVSHGLVAGDPAGEDGFALIEKVRALTPEQGRDIPAAALTAHAREEDRVRALAAGYQTHIKKPVDPTKLAATVASLGKKSKE